MRQTYEKGAVLFRQGDQSDGVYQIHSGSVVVVKEFEGEKVVLGRIGSGEFLGEMGVLEDLERSATAIVEDAVDAEVFDPAAFLTLVSSNSDLALNLLRRLSARLRDMNNQLVTSPGHASSGPVEENSSPGQDARHEVTLRGDTFALQFYIGSEPIHVAAFPYSVGRYREPGEDLAHPEPDLLIDDPQPYRLSPTHFVLDEAHGSVIIRDCYTDLGTIVNGKSLGRDFPVESLALDHGENEVIAGGESSPYRFTVLVAP